MTPEARDLLRAVIGDPAKAADVPSAAVPSALGALAELQAIFLARLVANGSGYSGTPKPEPEPDKLLTAEEAAPILGVAPRWLYRHARNLPFTRRLSRKALRFSEAGLRRYTASRKA